jgi:hypothetical protein
MSLPTRNTCTWTTKRKAALEPFLAFRCCGKAAPSGSSCCTVFEIAIASTPGLKYIRSNTVYALSFIRLQFEYGRDYHFVRQQTINRLREADLPQGVQPVISPAGTISEIFRYELKGPPGMDVLRELENISVGHGVSLLCWRSGGVEHPHDTPPCPFTPSPTFAHSSS